MKREASIELYRMLLMVGICLMHALQASGLGSVVMNRCLAEFHPSVFLSVVITVLVLFIGSVLLDLPRRMVVSLLLHRN